MHITLSCGHWKWMRWWTSWGFRLCLLFCISSTIRQEGGTPWWLMSCSTPQSEFLALLSEAWHKIELLINININIPIRMIYSISLIQRWPFCFTSIIFETGMHLIIDVASKTSWQCVPCWFFACFLVRYIQTLHLTIRGDVCVCVCVSVCVCLCVCLCVLVAQMCPALLWPHGL